MLTSLYTFENQVSFPMLFDSAKMPARISAIVTIHTSEAKGYDATN